LHHELQSSEKGNILGLDWNTNHVTIQFQSTQKETKARMAHRLAYLGKPSTGGYVIDTIMNEMRDAIRGFSANIREVNTARQNTLTIG